VKKLYTQAWLWGVFAVMVASATLLTAPLHAQTFYGSIVGTVTDSSGAIVPAAAVTVTDVATNEKHTAQSNAAGEYSFVNLVPATYKVDVQKANFKRFLRDQVVVQVNSTIRIDAALQVGAATETVEVTEQTPLLQTDSGTLSAVVEGKTVTEMPLNGRNTMNLLALAPNVVPLGNSMGATTLNGGGHTQVGEWADYSIGGSQGGQNAMYIDGAPLNVLGGGGGSSIGYVPAQDSVQEFNVTTNSSDAEYGRFSGGVINMTTKSGTNGWHGSAYEYLRNNKLNANEFFNKQAEYSTTNPNWNQRTQWNQNQFGGVFDGPIKKDKAFFMFNYEGFISRTASLNSANVPTADMQAGWVQSTPANPNGHPPSPGTTPNLAAIKVYCPDATSGTSPDGTPNSVLIPSSCWDPTAAVVITQWPSPRNGVGANNYNLPGSTGTNDKSYTVRVDYNLSEKQRLFGRYTASNIKDLSQETMPGGTYKGKLWHIGGGFTISRTISGVLGDTYTFNPTTILDARLSYMRWAESSANPTTGMDMSIFGGAWGDLQKSITETTNIGMNLDRSVNDVNISGFRGTGDGSKAWYDNEALSVGLTKIVGKHSLKIGIEDRYMDQVSDAPPWGWIGFTFDQNHFADSTWANILLGMPENASISNFSEVGSFNWYQGYYVNDSWQATHKLTITAGLRWELPGNIKEKRDRSMVLMPNLDDTSADWKSPDGVYTGVHGIAVPVNSSVYKDRGSEPAKHDLITPHAGFAYRLTNNDVIRGGYGFNVVAPDSQTGMFPQNYSMNTVNNSWDVTHQQTPHPLSDPFPDGLSQPPGIAGFDMNLFLHAGANLSAPVPTTKFPYTQQWNLGISHQFKGDLVVEIGYAGSRGTNMSMGQNLNELESKYWADQTQVNNWQSDRPYPAWSTFQDVIGNIGTYNYNSLPVRVEKRFKTGGVVTASYTWSKSIGDVNMASGGGPGGATGGVQDWYNLADEHTLTSYDVPQRLIVSYVVDLPFGKGQKYFAGVSNGVAQKLISGWAVNGITTYQQGFPLSFGSASYTQPGQNINIPNTNGAGLRPNVVASCSKKESGSLVDHVIAGTPLLNGDCWSAPTASTDYYVESINGVPQPPVVGYCPNLPPNSPISCTNYYTSLGNQRLTDGALRAPGIANWDFSAVKKTNITEKVNLEFRMEFFNIFNHTRFGAESTSVGASSVGGGFGATPFGVINSNSQGGGQQRLGQASLRLNF